jgi:PAS domain-containing protein
MSLGEDTRHFPGGSDGDLAKLLERYSSIVENAVEGIFQSTPQGHYLLVNPALAHMYGYASPEELINSVRDISKSVYVDEAMRFELLQGREHHLDFGAGPRGARQKRPRGLLRGLHPEHHGPQGDREGVARGEGGGRLRQCRQKPVSGGHEP